MAAHASWKGFLKLSLVSVPVKAYTATATGNDITLHQLHAKTHTRIQYKKFAPEVGEVAGDQIVKGYEYAKGQYVIVDEEELDKLRTESDKSVRIDGFIKADQLPSIYLGGRTYYLTPDGPVGQKPYSLLMKRMQANGVAAIAEVVISQKEQVVLLRPLDGVLAMTVLIRKDEVKPASAFKDEINESESSEAEVSWRTPDQASTLGLRLRALRPLQGKAHQAHPDEDRGPGSHPGPRSGGAQDHQPDGGPEAQRGRGPVGRRPDGWSGKEQGQGRAAAGPQRQARPHRRRQEEEGWLRPFRFSFPPCWPSSAGPSIRRNTSSSSSGTATAPGP
jgi:Ku protein